MSIAENHPNYRKDSLFKRFFKEYNRLSLIKKINFFTTYNDKKFKT